MSKEELEKDSEKDFKTHIDNLTLEGNLDPDLFDDEDTFSHIKDDYKKQYKTNYNAQAETNEIDKQEISTVDQYFNNIADKEKNRTEKDRDSAVSFSADQAQKAFGEAFSVIGDATGFQGLKEFGENVIKQQDEDIKQGGYIPSYKGSFTDQDGADLMGWTLEKILENSVSTVGTIGGLAVAALTAPVSGTAAGAITAGTATMTALGSIGSIAGELKQKKVYNEDMASQAIVIGLISASVDMIGAGKLVAPIKDAIIKEGIKSGAIKAAGKDVKKSLTTAGGIMVLSSGLSEVAQEGVIIANGASEGADYDTKEVVNRFVDSFVVGAAMGTMIGAPKGVIDGAIKANRINGEENTPSNIAKNVSKQHRLDGEIKGTFSGRQVEGLTPSQLRRLAADTVRTEAPRNKAGEYDQTGHNKHGYQGLYQFGASALTDIGLIKKSAYKNAPKHVKNGTDQQDWLSDPKNWTTKGGLDEFLNSRDMQDKAFTSLAERNLKQAIKRGAIDPNNAGDVAGFIKAAHLVGGGAAVKYFKTGKDKKDGNGTRASKYANDAREAIKGESGTRRQERQRTANTRARSITDSNNNKHDFEYEVVDASTVNNSVGKSKNQYRDRSRSALKDQTDEISENLDYDLVSNSPTLSDGAPVLSKDGQLIAGYGRLTGIKGAYDKGKAEDYKNRMLDDAEILGLDKSKIEGLENPVLVRKLKNTVDNTALARASNETGTAKNSSLEQARIDAETIGDISQVKIESNGRMSKNSEISILQQLLKNTPTSEHNALVDADGNISKEGTKRVQTAVLYNAYGESKTLELLVEKDSETELNILNGLSQAAPIMAEMNALIDAGLLHDAKINESIAEAVAVINRINNSKKETVEGWLKQKDLLSPTSESTRTIVANFHKARRSPKQIKEFLIKYSQRLKKRGSPEQNSLFPTPEISTNELLTEAVNTKYKEPKKAKSTANKTKTNKETKKKASDNTPPEELKLTGNQKAEEKKEEGARDAGDTGDAGGDGGSKPPENKEPEPKWTPPEGGKTAEELADATPTPIKDFLEKIKEFTDKNFRSTTETLGARAQNLLERTQSKLDGEYVKWKTKKLTNQINDVKKEYKGEIPFDHNIALRKLLSGKIIEDQKILNDKRFQKLATIAEKMRQDIDQKSTEIAERIEDDANRLITQADKKSDEPSNLSYDELISLRDRNNTHKKNNPKEKPLISKTIEEQINLAETIKSDVGNYNTRAYAIHRSKNWEEKILNGGGEFKKRRMKAIQYFIDKINNKKHKLTADEVGEKAKHMMVQMVRENARQGASMQENAGFKAGQAVTNKKKDQELSNSRALRELLGEYTDPLVSYSHTMEVLIKAKGIKDFHQEFGEIAERENLDIRSEPDEEGKLVRIETKEGGLVNPLEGKWTTPIIADYINRASLTESDDWKAAIRVNSLWQSMHTVYSIPTVASNIVSILPVMLATSSLSGRSTIDSVKAMRSLFGNKQLSKEDAIKWKKTYGISSNEMLDFMAQNQINHGGAVGGESTKYLTESGDSWIGQKFDDTFTDEFKGTGIKQEGRTRKAREAIGTAGIKTKDGFQKLYNFGDSLPKTLIFLNEVQRLTEIQKLSPDAISKDQIMESAAHLAKQQAPQYSRVPKAVDLIRKFPTMGQFVAFKAQLYQTTMNMARQNFALLRPTQNAEFIKEHFGINLENIKDSEQKQSVISALRKRGASKSFAMVGTMTMFGTAANIAVKALMGDDSEEPEDMDAINALMPDYYRLSNKQYVGRDENGTMEFINTARLNMYGDLGATLKVIDLYSNGQIESGGQATKMFLDTIMSPFYEPTFVAKLTKATSENKDSFNKAIIADEDGIIGNAGNVISYLAREIVENGTSKVITEMAEDMFSESEVNERTGYEHSTANAALTAAGFATIKFDPKKQMTYWFHRTKQKDRKMRSRLSGSLKSYYKQDDNEILKNIRKSKEQHEIIYGEMISKIEAARLSGVEEIDILDAITLSGSGKENFKKYLSRGKIPPFMIQKMGESQIKQSNFKSLSNDAKITFAENYQNARKILNNTIWE